MRHLRKKCRAGNSSRSLGITPTRHQAPNQTHAARAGHNGLSAPHSLSDAGMFIGRARAGQWLGPAPHSNAPSSSRPNSRGAGGAMAWPCAPLQRAIKLPPKLTRRGRDTTACPRPTPADQTHAARAGPWLVSALLQPARIIRVVGMGCGATACPRPTPARLPSKP